MCTDQSCVPGLKPPSEAAFRWSEKEKFKWIIKNRGKTLKLGLSIYQGFWKVLKVPKTISILCLWSNGVRPKMPTCSGQRISKLEPGCSQEMKKDVLQLDFPQNAGVRWNKNCPPPNQYKGIYTWTSTPRALHQNRKLIRESLNLQRWVKKAIFKGKQSC